MWMSDDLEDGGPQETLEELSGDVDYKRLGKKIIVIIIAVVLVVSSFGAWYVVFRHWSIEEIGMKVVGSGSSPGFDPFLAGTSVFVEGRVTQIEMYNSTLGPLTFIELDDFSYIDIVEWKEPSVKIGDILVKEIHFEWSRFNDEVKVYSPQLDFPVFGYTPSNSVVMEAVSCISGMCLVPRNSDFSHVTIINIHLSKGEAFPLNLFNASLKKGVHSWAGELLDVTRHYVSNPELDFIESLDNGTGSNGNLLFVDANLNGLLDGEDHFEAYLDRPSEDSAVLTYFLRINGLWRSGQRGVLDGYCHIVMTNRGVLHLLVEPEPTSLAFDFGWLEIVSESSGVGGVTTEMIVADLWSPPLRIEDSGCRLTQDHWSLDCNTLDDGVVASEGNVSISFDDVDPVGYLSRGDSFLISGLTNLTEYTFRAFLFNGDIFGLTWTTGIGQRTGYLPVIDWGNPEPLDEPSRLQYKLRIDRMYGIPAVTLNDPDELFTFDLVAAETKLFSSVNLTHNLSLEMAPINITFFDADDNGYVNSGDYFVVRSSIVVSIELVLNYMDWVKDDLEVRISWPISWRTG